MKKWLLITVVFFIVITFGLLISLYVFLDVPYQKNEIQKIIDSVDEKFEELDTTNPPLLSELSQLARDQKCQLFLSKDMQSGGIISPETLTQDQINHLKKYFQDSLPCWLNILDLLEKRKNYYLNSWLDPKNISDPERPDLNALAAIFRNSLQVSYWAALSGDLSFLMRLTRAQSRLIEVLILFPSSPMSLMGNVLKMELFELWAPLWGYLSGDSRARLKEAALDAEFKKLWHINVPASNVIAAELYFFDMITSLFNKEVAIEMRKRGLTGPDFILKPLFIRDKKIGQMKLFQVYVGLNKNESEFKKSLAKYKERTILTPLTQMLLPDPEILLNRLKESKNRIDSLATFFELPEEELKPKSEGAKAWPLPLFELYSADELARFTPESIQERQMTASLLENYKQAMLQPFFSSDLYDAYKFQNQMRGVLIGAVQPGSLFEHMGLLVQDVLVAIDSVPVVDLVYEDVLTKLDTNKKITLHVVRQGMINILRVNIN